MDLTLPADNVNRLKALRTAAGLTQSDLAAKVGCTRSAVANWESGTHAPEPQIAAKLGPAIGAALLPFEAWYREEAA